MSEDGLLCGQMTRLTSCRNVSRSSTLTHFHRALSRGGKEVCRWIAPCLLRPDKASAAAENTFFDLLDVVVEVVDLGGECCGRRYAS